MSSRPYAAILAIIALVTLGACQKKEPEPPAPAKAAADEAAKKAAAAPAQAEPAAAPAPAPQPNPERNAYFGETHLHTSWSVDAWVMGNRITGPADAYKYAQGETIKHPMGFDIKIDTPLDFMGVTDHSEYVGVTKQANTPGSYVSTLPAAQPMIMKDPNSQEEQNRVFSYLLKLNSGAPVKALMDPKITATVWKENVQIADEQNKPGKFTAFCSYEWTSMPDNRNLHRNVFFRDCDKVPDYPFSSLDSTRPTELWNWMDAQRKAGNELLAISHNANVSDGWMYPVDVDNTTGRPIDAAWADSRDAQRAPGRDQAGQGPIGDASTAVAQRRVRQLRAVPGHPRPAGRRRPHRPHHGQLRAPGVQGRHRDAGHARLQPVQVRHGRRLRLAQHRQPLPPGQLLRPARRCGRHGRAALCRRADRRHDGRAPGKPRRADRRVGRGEHPGFAVGRDVPQGDLWRQRSAHQGALVRRLGLQQGHRQGQRLGQAVLCGRRADGRRPAADALGGQGHGAELRRLGGEGPDLGQSRPHPGRQGLDAERPELREGLRRRVVRRPQARQVVRPRAGHPQHGGPGQGHLHERRRLGGTEDGVDRSGVRREPARLLLRPRAGDSHAALDPDPGRQGRAAAARRRAADGAGTRLELADLVRAVGRGAQERAGGHDRQRAGQEGGRRPE